MASVMTPNVYRVFFRHQRLENSAFNMQNSLAKVWYSMNVFYSFFVLFDISLEIFLMQFHNGKNVHTQKVVSPWARPRAFYPRVKWQV